MALTNPDYSGYKTLSQYANQLAFIKKQYAEGNTGWATAEAAKIRWQAVLNGFDLKILETQAVTKLGQDPNAIDWQDFEKNTATPLTTAVTLANIKKAYDAGQMTEQAAHDEAQRVRLDAAYKGLDMLLLEQRAEQLSDPAHKESSEASIDEAMRTYVAEAEVAAKLLKNAEYWDRIDKDPNLTSGQKDWYKNQVHNDSQNLRAEALRNGLNLWNIEKLYVPIQTGRPWSNADYENAKGYIDTLYKAAGQDPSGISVPNFSSGGTINDFAYKLPTVHKTMMGETYSGADMVVFFAFPGFKPVEIGVATTVSITTYREKKQIRTIGRISTRGITRGPRTVSGKLIFTVIHEHIVESLKAQIPYLSEYRDLKFDELPSFDILISMGTEYGASATLVINGVTSVDEQKTFSIEELFTENIFTYLARDYQPLRATQKNSGETYDPQEWFSYKFREKGSELIGNFGLDDIMLSEYSKSFAAALPALNGGDAWESLSASDVMKSYYKQLGNDEANANQAKALAAAAEKSANGRQIFIQVFSKKTNKPINKGKITIRFDGDVYDPTSSGEVDGTFYNYNREDGDYDWSKATASDVDSNKYYGLYVIPDNEPPAGVGFLVGYSGYKGGAGESTYTYTSINSTISQDRFTYVKVMVEEEVDKTQYLIYQPGDTTYFLKTYYQSYGNGDYMPSLSELTTNNYKDKVQKSFSGDEWVTCEVWNGDSSPAVGKDIRFSWELFDNFFVGGNAQFDKRDRIASYKSTSAMQYLFQTDAQILKTNAHGQVSVRLKDLVCWISVKDEDGDGYKERIMYDELPAGMLLKIYASIDNGQYIQWMVRKTGTASDR